MDAMRQFEGTMVDDDVSSVAHIVVTGGYFFWGMSCVNRVWMYSIHMSLVTTSRMSGSRSRSSTPTRLPSCATRSREGRACPRQTSTLPGCAACCTTSGDSSSCANGGRSATRTHAAMRRSGSKCSRMKWGVSPAIRNGRTSSSAPLPCTATSGFRRA